MSSDASTPAAEGAARRRHSAARRLRGAKAATFLLCLAPGIWTVAAVFGGGAGANPVEYLTHQSGQWGLILLLASLAMTPLRRFGGWLLPIRLRRMVGLFAFAYVCMHFLVFSVFDHSLSVSGIVDDVLNRPYILVGFVSLLLLIPLAATSTDAMMRRLGRRWKRLHRLVYLSAGLAVLHFLWQVRPGDPEPWIYAAALLLLLLLRLPSASRLSRRSP